MADKEATVYVVDVGKFMGEQHESGQTKLEYALSYVWDRITGVMALDRKTTLQAVVALRTDGTDHNLDASDTDYHHITVLENLKALSLTNLRDLHERLVPSHTDRGDAISALVVAIQMIATTCKKLKYIRRIVMVTSLKGSWSGDNLSDIIQKLDEDGITLTVLGVDCGPQSETVERRSKTEEANEALIRQIVPEEEPEGGSRHVFAPVEEAVGEMGIPRLKSTKPVPSFKGQLLLGDPINYEDALCIDVERYPRTMLRRAPTASSFSVKDAAKGEAPPTEAPDTVMGDDDSNSLGVVRNQRMYEVIDASMPKGKKEVPFEELAKGFEYGRTAVHVSESDMPILRMETLSGLEIVGFIPAENFDRYMALSRSNVILAQRNNTKAIMALSSFVHALHELSSVAIARLVVKADKAPELVLLAPVIEAEAEYLVDVALPFAEDVRSYRFPPLDRVILASGKSITVHRHLPEKPLQDAMDRFVEGMDLDTHLKKAAEEDDEDNNNTWDPSAFAGSGDAAYDAFSPIPHRIDAAIRHRATHPTATIPAAYPILTKYAAPPSELVPDVALETLIGAAGVKKVPPQSAATRRQRKRESAATTVSGLDVAGLLARRTPQPRVDPANPIPSFRQMLDTTTDPDGIRKAAEQFGAVVEDRVRGDAAGVADERVLEELRTLRSEMIEMEEPGVWNAWARAFRGKLLRGELGGERRELWFKVRAQGKTVGLIDEGRGAVSAAEAEQYWTFEA